MNLSEIKQKLIGASFLYHKDRDARLESVQIGTLPFRLVRTSDYHQHAFNNYLVKTPTEYTDFSYQDVREGRVFLLSSFSLTEIKNSKTRESFAKKMSKAIKERLSDKDFITLDSFMG